MKVGPFSGVQISHHVSGHDWWLSDIGNVDYAIIEYEDVKAHKGEPKYQTLLLEG